MRVRDDADGIHIHRHRILGQGFFRLETSRDDARVDPVRNRINHRNDEKQSRSLKGVEVAQTQYHGPIPLISNLNCVRNGESQDKGAGSDPDRFRVSANFIPGVCQCGANACNYNEYQY